MSRLTRQTRGSKPVHGNSHNGNENTKNPAKKRQLLVDDAKTSSSPSLRRNALKRKVDNDSETAGKSIRVSVETSIDVNGMSDVTSSPRVLKKRAILRKNYDNAVGTDFEEQNDTPDFHMVGKLSVNPDDSKDISECDAVVRLEVSISSSSKQIHLSISKRSREAF